MIGRADIEESKSNVAQTTSVEGAISLTVGLYLKPSHLLCHVIDVTT